MRHFVNQALIRRNSLIGKALVWGGLAIVIGSVLISLQSPDVLNPYVFGGFLGVIATQIGTLLTNRWGRSPRLDEVIGNALKGMDERFVFFSYILRVDHALLSPAGTFVLIPRPEDGVIDYQDGDWLQDRPKRGLLQRGGRRSLSGFERQARTDSRKLQRKLAKHLSEESIPEVQPIFVFFHPDAQIQVTDSPFPAVHVKKLKAWLRKLPKGISLPSDQVDALIATLGY
ncbi:MAG TPA: hypothetical protein G4O08_06530 [Anaerolineae bacterium]|nr:hypothetical protein [Anaerolineae bacterium]